MRLPFSQYPDGMMKPWGDVPFVPEGLRASAGRTAGERSQRALTLSFKAIARYGGVK